MNLVSPSTANILLLEPDRHIRYLLQRLLDKHGYSVSEVADSNHASQFLNKLRPALIIMEPAADFDWSFLSNVRNLPFAKSPSVVFTTCLEEYGLLPPLEFTRNLKAILFKPFDVDILLNMSKRLIQAHKSKLL